MNYTENYHLPQWDEDDRIMRVDFNQMCADMENGLSRNAAGAAQANAQTAADAAAAVEAAESRAFDQACRLAYNHYCFAQTITPFPRQIGVFHLDTSLSDEGLVGLVKLADYYQMNNTAQVDAAGLLALFQQTELIADNSKPLQSLTATFTAPSNGLIHQVSLHSAYSGMQSTTTTFNCLAECKDLTTGETLFSEYIDIVLTSGAGNTSHRIMGPLLLVHGHRYEISVTPQYTRAGTFHGDIDRLYYSSGATGGTGTASYTFRDPAENLGLVAVASYQITKNCPEPKLLADGEEVPVWWSRAVEDGKGNTIREIVFRRSGAVKSGETLQLQLFCGEEETLTLYSWGVTLI